MNRIATNAHGYYAVTPGVAAAWRELLVRIAGAADVTFDFLPYPPSQSQEELWARSDAGCQLRLVMLEQQVPIRIDGSNIDRTVAN